MKNTRQDYKRRRAELIHDMRKKGMSFNKISVALGNAITPQRIAQIDKHYVNRVIPLLEEQKRDMLDSYIDK